MTAKLILKNFICAEEVTELNRASKSVVSNKTQTVNLLVVRAYYTPGMFLFFNEAIFFQYFVCALVNFAHALYKLRCEL